MNLPRVQLSVFADLQRHQGLPRGRRLDPKVLHELVSFGEADTVTSLYIDIDGRHRPALGQCDTALESLFRQARRRAEKHGPAAIEAVEEDLSTIRDWISEGVDRSRTRGLAFFSCAGRNWLEVLVLPVAVRDEVSVSDHPNVGQLEEIVDRDQTVLLVLVDTQQARLVRARLGTWDELDTIVDPVERQVDNDVELGSWEHRHEEALRRHLRRVTAETTGYLDRNKGVSLVVGGPPRAVDEFKSLLPSAVRDRIVERVKVGVQCTDEDLAEVLANLWDELERRRQTRLIDDLNSRIGTGEAVARLEATLEALNDRSVGTLIVARGWEAVGARCLRCGHLAVATRDCPWCSQPVRIASNIVDDAIESALAQGARIELVAQPDLEHAGRIAAIKRHR